jgi:hypothetical protein
MIRMGDIGMRGPALIALLALASCGDDAGQNQTAPAVASPSPGQWELASQVTRFVKSDQGAARIDTPVGSRATQSLCVAPGARLPTELFSGEGFTCTYGSYYVRGGRASVSLTCSREGLTGNILMNATGTFGADSISLHRDLRTILTTDGDVQIDADVTGRRTGACAPAAASEGQNRQ